LHERGLSHFRFNRLFELYDDKNISIAEFERLGWEIEGAVGVEGGGCLHEWKIKCWIPVYC